MKTTLVVTCLWIAIAFAGIYGWGRCIYKFTSCDFKPSYKAEVVYGAGIFLGYGAIIGYLDLGK